MNENYINLCSFNFGKHCYVIIKNSFKAMYFENVAGKYVLPITSFNLYDNQGKSLTSVNQHFFMSQLVNRINIAFKKGFFSTDQDAIDYLLDLKSKIENDVSLRSLFKGSLMKEIDEENFEINKKEIINYLDKFRYDTFTSYNNVSIFNGSLEKDNVLDSKAISDTDVTDNSGVESFDAVKDDLVETIDDIDNNVSGVSNTIVEQNNFASDVFDFTNISSNDNNDSINSNDYFGSLDNFNSDVQGVGDVSGLNSNDNFSQVDSKPVMNETFDNVVNTMNDQVNNSVDASNNLNNQFDNNLDLSNNIQNNFNSEDQGTIDALDFNSNDNFSQVDSKPVMNETFDNVVNTMNDQVNNSVDTSNNLNNQFDNILDLSNSIQKNSNSEVQDVGDVSGLNSNDYFNLSDSFDNNQDNINVSYIDGVKDRLSSGYNNSNGLNQPQFNSEMGTESLGFSTSNVSLGDNIISDKNELSELEKIPSSPLQEDNPIDKVDKKSHLGIIIFMIFLVLVLGVLAYYLYNYVF